MASGGAGGSIGARLSRVLTPRLGAELSVDYSLARLQITQANSDSIEATRASFIPVFNGLITFNPSRVLNSLTSTAALDSRGARQFFTSGALIINLRTSGDVIPYATVGAGLISTTGKMPSATLRGNYQFLLVLGQPINETDNVTVREARNDRTVAGIVGGGVKYHVSPRWGIRLNARVSLSKNTASTVLDATPNVALGLLPAGRGFYNVDPTIQFSNNSSDPTTALGVTAVGASSLTGPPLTGLRTFAGSGVSSPPNITAGIFWRFRTWALGVRQGRAASAGCSQRGCTCERFVLAWAFERPYNPRLKPAAAACVSDLGTTVSGRRG